MSQTSQCSLHPLLQLTTAEDAYDAVEAEHKRMGKLSKFPIAKATRKALKARGVKYLFPIQYLTFDHIHGGKDLIGQARKQVITLDSNSVWLV